MIVLVIKLEIEAGKKAEFTQIAQKLVEGSQKEAGNIEYHAYEELDEPNTVAFIEKWQDQAALDFHEQTAHFTQNIGKLQALCVKPPVTNRFDILA